MKKILILAIALLFVAGLAMAELTVTAQFKYAVAVNYNADGTASSNVRNGNDNRIYMRGGNDFTKGAFEIRIYNDRLAAASLSYDIQDLDEDDPADGVQLDELQNLAFSVEGDVLEVREAYFQLNVLGALGVEGLPLKLAAQFGVDEVKAGQFWDITNLEHARRASSCTNHTLAGWEANWFVKAVIMDMVTVVIGQRTNESHFVSQPSYEQTLAPTLIDVKAVIDFINVGVYVELEQANSGADMSAMVAGGVMADLAKLIGMDMISALKLAIVVGSDNALDAAGADFTFGAALAAKFNLDPVSIYLGLGTGMEYVDANSPIFSNLGVELEIWYDKFGIAVTSNLGFATAGGGDAELLGTTGIWLMANLGGVNFNLGYVMTPDDEDGTTGNAPLYNRMGDYGNDSAPAKGSAGLNFRAKVSL
ncbi:MAG: hypothetical protein JW904_14495 [Spirochaetales bacterium]|nr:hypothetical protein [Spirochaetales bacterium]